MNLKKKFVVGAASLALVAGMGAPMAVADPVNNRLAGADRYDTAIAVALDGVESGQGDFASEHGVVYLASGQSLVDAVAAGTLEGGPTLLVNGNAAVQSKVAAAVKKLNPAKIYVIGGEGVVSEDAVKAVAGAIPTERVAGADRYETAAKIAELKAAQLKDAGKKLGTVYLANGETMVDALVGGMVMDGPILLAQKGSIPAATAKALNTLGTGPNLVVFGGVGAVSDEVAKQALVDQSILVDSFVSDYQAAAKAKAEADVKVNGYVTFVAGKTAKDLANYGTLNNDEKVMASQTYPKLDLTIANKAADGTETVFQQKAANGTIPTTGVTLANATLAGDLAYTEGGPAYAGTAKTVTDVIKLNGTPFMFTTGAANTDVFGVVATPAASTVNVKTTKMAAGTADTPMGGSGSVAALATYFPGTFTSESSIQDFLKALGISAPKANNVYTNDGANNGEATDAKAAFDQNVAVAKAGMAARVTAAKTANDEAMKAKAAADKTWANVTKGGAANPQYDRWGGADRYETSVVIAGHIYGDKAANFKNIKRVYFANGTAFADAAVSGMLNMGPVLLVKKDAIPASVSDYVMAIEKAQDLTRAQGIAIGGAGVVSDENLKAQLDKIAPVTEASGSISFGTPTGDTTNNTAAIPVTYKDMPNGTTLTLVWEYKDDANQTATDGSTTKRYPTGVTVGDDGANPFGSLKDGVAYAKVTAGAAAGSSLRVKVVAKNASGEVVTSATSGWVAVK